MTKNLETLNGTEVKALVIAEMIKRGVDNSALAEAVQIHFPRKPIILGTSMKVRKGEKGNVLTSIVYLAPATESVAYGGCNMCPLASAGCAKACLGSNCKRLVMSTGRNSKAWKTLLWLYRPDIFKALLIRDIRNLEKRANKKGYTPAVRLNGTSDVVWEIHFSEIFDMFPNVVFYDYTKIETRFYRQLPSNYHLTFSRSEVNEEAVERLLAGGFNVAIVFSDLERAMREGYKGYRVINGDNTDYRPSDEKGVVVGLTIKGNAKDDTGFIIQNGTPAKGKKSRNKRKAA